MPILASSFDSDLSAQSAIGILLISVALALIIVGVIIFKFRILDTKRFGGSRPVGMVMIFFGAIVLAVSILGLVHVNFFMS